MAQYAYQYETSPRKLKTDYREVNRKSKTVKNSKKSKDFSKKEEIEKSKKEQADEKLKNKAITRRYLFIKTLMFFGILFLMILVNAQTNEVFSKIQNLKSEITAIQKENSQIEVNIQNSLNLNNIEQAAKDLLGMKKLSTKQIVYITLPEEDYVETSSEKINIIEGEDTIIDKIKYILKNIF